MQKRIEFGGKVYEFPSDFTDAEIAAALEGQSAPAAAKPQQQETPSSLASTALDFGKGVLKGAGRQALDLGRLVMMQHNPALMPGLPASGELPPNPDALSSSNAAQTAGGVAADVASIAVPAGRASMANPLLRRAANRLERVAVPEMTERSAGMALERGRGVVSRSNAAALRAEAKATPQESSIMIKRGRNWVPRETNPSKLQPTADAMTRAAEAKTRDFSQQELLSMAGRSTLGWMLSGGNPTIGAAIGASKLLGRPLPSSMIAQGLHSAAPALNAAGGGGAGYLAQLALRSLFGEQEK
jgi:hypothetical protein